MMRSILIAVLFIALFAVSAFGQEITDDNNDDGKIDRWIYLSGGTVERVEIDRDFDGKVDYIIFYDEEDLKKEEQLDYNYDGEMDDLYLYVKGKLKRREIDTNYDSKIDVWVYLDGIYIEKYEKDTDFDGEIDFIKNYLEE
jgi:hypothetical protein